MTVLRAFVAIIVYATIAFLATAAGTQKAKSDGGVTLFPVLKAYRLLVWSGGMACALGAAKEYVSEGVTLVGVLFAAIAVATALLPLQLITVSNEGVGTVAVLLTKSILIPWKEVVRVEQRPSRNQIVVIGKSGSVTHTRYNADPELFESLLETHLDKARRR